jgi:Glycosyl transferases group 1
MKYILKNIISILPGKIVDELKIQLKSPLINIYNTGFDRNVLISYIRRPFKKGSDLKHTNSAEVLEIARVFKELKFNIDVVNYDYEGFLDYAKYDLIFGFGEPLNNCFDKKRKNTITIYYGTGMHVSTQNHNSLKRIENVHRKKGVWLISSGRIVEKAWSVQTSLVDFIITLGNNEVTESYKKFFGGKIFNIPASYYEIMSAESVKKILNDKNYDEAKKHFVWIGSSGLIHKGLDLLLEYFCKNKNLHLHILGPIDGEPDFKKVYFNELYNSNNIHTYGFIDLRSQIFYNLMEKCEFVIFPSCAEGGGASVINCMANGLIPIVSREASISIKDYGYLIKELTVEAIDSAINTVLYTENKLLKERSLKCMLDTRETHSIQEFSINLKGSIETALNLKNEL